MPKLSLQSVYQIACQHHESGRLDEAESLYRQILQYAPEHADTLQMLGVLAQQRGRNQESLDLMRRSITLNPDQWKYYCNLGMTLSAQGELDEAIDAYRKAISLGGESALICNNLGTALKLAGDADEAIACYRRAWDLNPTPIDASNLLFYMHFLPGFTPQQIYQQHVRWNELFARALAPAADTHSNDPTPQRRLRIGYVSSALCERPVGRFLLPLLENHDHRAFQIFCYADIMDVDPISQRLRAAAHVWRQTLGMSDEQLAQQVREHGIDILIDLGLHADGGRPLLFARKPAPVQVSYLAYVSTTGLETVDYRLTDPYLDPPGMNDEYYSEQSIRLPRTYWCYPQPLQAPEVGPLPSSTNGYITFGCMNNFSKVSGDSLETWAKILGRVPRSRLLLHAQIGSHRQRVCDRFASHGIDPVRIEFVRRLPLAEYFAQFGRIDISLDPFPYAGGTTTCDSLWMGVPVVSLVGQTAVSRGGLSVLSNLKLANMVAHCTDDYIRIAASLAADPARLAALRGAMRPRMAASPLMDGPQFARDVEAALRGMWKTWCAKRQPQRAPTPFWKRWLDWLKVRK